ncbi:MAG: 50S ribosomal protein L1 [Euryarchaeota archaeon]|nr:50S ribosomal protein L1 [Euryarchaeota archaeon]
MAKIAEAVQKARTAGKQRNFTQSIDLVINLREIDLSKPENRINEEIVLPHGRGRDIKVAVIADGELALQAQKAGADLVITRKEIEEYAKDKKKLKQIANVHKFFVAQTDIMPLVGKHFGPVLGPRGKMPKPVPSNIAIVPLLERLKKTVRLQLKERPILHVVIGNEKMDNEKIAENVEAVLARLEMALDKGKNQIGSVYIKSTMGSPVKLDIR